MNSPLDIGMLPTCDPTCAAKAPLKVGLDNGMWAFSNWKGLKLLEGFQEDMGIDETILFAKKLPNDPIVTRGIPYENGFDALCVCNGCWAIPPKGIKVEGLGCGVVEGTGYGVAALVPTIVVIWGTIGGTISEAFIVAIWSKGNILKVLVSWSKSLKLAKSGFGSPTIGVFRVAWTGLGVSSISTE